MTAPVPLTARERVLVSHLRAVTAALEDADRSYHRLFQHDAALRAVTAAHADRSDAAALAAYTKALAGERPGWAKVAQRARRALAEIVGGKR